MRSEGHERRDQRSADFEAFVLRYTREFGRLAYLLTGDAESAEDLVADAFLAAWSDWDRVSTTMYPRAYVRQIISNKAASWIRRQQTGRTKLLLFRADAQAFLPAPSGNEVDVHAALSQLPPRRRACVVLRLVFDLSERETAKTLGISVGTVKSQTFKGVALLRQLLGEDTAELFDGPTNAPATEPGGGD